MRLVPLMLTTLLVGAAAAPDIAVSQPYLTGRQQARARLDAEAAVPAAVPGEQVFDIPIGGQTTQRILYAAPVRPFATIIMFPGGAGDVGVRRDGDLRQGDNFVVRTRAQWIALGYAVLIPDTIDHANLRGLRSSPAYATLIQDLIDFAHTQSRGPVVLLGTSQGSIAAMNGAAHARAGSISGLVLTESVSVLGHSGETVFSADPGRVRVPALVVANRDDNCDVAPPQAAPTIAAAMTSSASVQVLNVSGGIHRSDKPCGSLTPHGYFEIEPAVIGQIDRWIHTHLSGVGSKTQAARQH